MSFRRQLKTFNI